ncbi:carbon storage regulator [Stenotrophomonas maltophilia]|uniref:carbon storage regulator n=1 Tax=Stenotrophomonas maltophilia TaxID=40324 RepID=UPI0039C3520E
MSRDCLTQQDLAPSRAAGAKVINQKEGGLIRIGDSIDVVVLKARDGRTRLVISAPRNLQITAQKQ